MLISSYINYLQVLKFSGLNAFISVVTAFRPIESSVWLNSSVFDLVYIYIDIYITRHLNWPMFQIKECKRIICNDIFFKYLNTIGLVSSRIPLFFFISSRILLGMMQARFSRSGPIL